MTEFLEMEIGGFSIVMLCSALLLAVICLAAIKLILRLVDKGFSKSHLDPTLQKLLRIAIKALLLFIAVVVVLGYLNIPVTSLVAILSVVGVAVSLSVQNFLSNVIGGLQLMASKPFTEGDFVEMGGCSGTVADIGLFYTKLHTGDKKLVQIPNSAIVSANITNYSCEELRRVDISISASYDDSTEHVRDVLLRMAKEHPLAKADPEPVAHVAAFNANDIAYTLRVWCENGDYWTVYFDLMDAMQSTFEKEGISMSYPHVNVHMVEK